MDWLTGGKQGEAKRLINQLSDPGKREHAAQELIRLGNEAVTPLAEALQTRDTKLLPHYQQILARIPSATPLLIRLLKSAHPVIRGRVAEVLILSRDRAAVPALLDAVQGEYFTVRSRAALALGKMGDPRTSICASCSPAPRWRGSSFTARSTWKSGATTFTGPAWAHGSTGWPRARV